MKLHHIIIILFTLSTQIFAQMNGGERGSAAIGLDLNQISGFGTPAQISIIANIQNQLRASFSFGYNENRTILDDDTYQYTSIYVIETTPQLIINKAENMDFLVGMVLGTQFVSQGVQDGDDNEGDLDFSFYVGPVVGMEFFLAENFSLTGQVGAIYARETEDKDSDSPAQSSRASYSKITLAWYL